MVLFLTSTLVKHFVNFISVVAVLNKFIIIVSIIIMCGSLSSVLLYQAIISGSVRFGGQTQPKSLFNQYSVTVDI